MKKTIFVLTAGLFILASCKKDYTCECVVGTTVISTKTINDTKSNAKTTCAQDNTTIFGTTMTCTIK